MPKRSIAARIRAEMAERTREAVARARRTQADAATGTSSLGADSQEEETARSVSTHV